MTTLSRCCLICDDVAVAEVRSVMGQRVALCAGCYRDYYLDLGGLVADEVRKYFSDGARGDRPQNVKAEEVG